jgi:hypothetical protein
VHIGEPLAAIPLGTALKSGILETAAAALEAGYTELHRRDLEPNDASWRGAAATE